MQAPSLPMGSEEEHKRETRAQNIFGYNLLRNDNEQDSQRGRKILKKNYAEDQFDNSEGDEGQCIDLDSMR